MKRLLVALIPFAVSALFVAGCGESNSDDSGCDPLADGEDVTLGLCDITVSSCQCHVYKWVSVQRGESLFQPPITDSITRDEYQASLDRGGDDGDGDKKVDAFGEVLRMVGYNNSERSLTDDENATRGSGVAAFYSTRSERVTIITDEGTSSSDERAVTLLAHEYAHAQQDTEGYFDYLNRRILDADMLLAARASIEGEAELIETFAALALANLPRDQWDWKSASDDLQKRYADRSLEDDNPYPLANLIFPYPFGAEMFASSYFGATALKRDCLFAKEADEDRAAANLTQQLEITSDHIQASALRGIKVADQFGGDYRDVREQRCSFPTQSRQFLTEQYGPDARAAGYTDQIQDDFSEPALPDGLQLAQTFRPMGAWHYFLYLQFAYPSEFDSDSAAAAVALLRGDRLYTVEDADGDTLFGGWWFYMLDDDAAESLSEVLIANPDDSSEQWSVFVDGPHVVLTVGQETNEEWRTWLNDLPARYDQFLSDKSSGRGAKSLATPQRDRPQLPIRIY